jgi:hypothetical protein
MDSIFFGSIGSVFIRMSCRINRMCSMSDVRPAKILVLLGINAL